MTIWAWIFGVGFLLFAFILLAYLFMKKNIKMYIRYRIYIGVCLLLGTAIPVLSFYYVPKDTFTTILIVNITVFGILYYICALLSLKHLNLYIWEIPYDDEKTMTKLAVQQDKLHDFVVGMPIYALIIAIIFIIAKVTD